MNRDIFLVEGISKMIKNKFYTKMTQKSLEKSFLTEGKNNSEDSTTEWATAYIR